MGTRNGPEIWKEYAVGWHFPHWLCGGVPQDPDIVGKWLRARMPAAKPPEAREIADIQEEVLETLAAPAEEREIGINTFQRVPGAMVGYPETGDVLVVRAATIRAHLKDCARAVGKYVAGRVEGEAAFSTRFINCVYPDGPEQYWVPILRSGKPLMEEDGWEEKPFSAMTPRGKISAFKRVGYAEGVDLVFRLWVVKSGEKVKGAVSPADIEKVMLYGGTHGFGAERGMGHGRYVVRFMDEDPDGPGREFWWRRRQAESTAVPAK